MELYSLHPISWSTKQGTVLDAIRDSTCRRVRLGGKGARTMHICPSTIVFWSAALIAGGFEPFSISVSGRTAAVSAASTAGPAASGDFDSALWTQRAWQSHSTRSTSSCSSEPWKINTSDLTVTASYMQFLNACPGSVSGYEIASPTVHLLVNSTFRIAPGKRQLERAIPSRLFSTNHTLGSRCPCGKRNRSLYANRCQFNIQRGSGDRSKSCIRRQQQVRPISLLGRAALLCTCCCLRSVTRGYDCVKLLCKEPMFIRFMNFAYVQR